jgi:hypothetical protein
MNWRWGLVVFLFVHGGIAAAQASGVPESWLVGNRRSAGLALTLIAGLVLVTSGAALVAHASAWRALALTGAALSLVFFLIFFQPLILFGLGLDVAMLPFRRLSRLADNSDGWRLAQRAPQTIGKRIRHSPIVQEASRHDDRTYRGSRELIRPDIIRCRAHSVARRCQMADGPWADRYAVDSMLIREMLLRERNEVTDQCMRDRRVGRRRALSPVSIAVRRPVDLATLALANSAASGMRLQAAPRPAP